MKLYYCCIASWGFRIPTVVVMIISVSSFFMNLSTVFSSTTFSHHASTIANTNRIMMIDLSYHPYIDSNIITDLIHNSVRHHNNNERSPFNEKDYSDVSTRSMNMNQFLYDVDLSHSILGDEGFIKIVDCLFDPSSREVKITTKEEQKEVTDNISIQKSTVVDQSTTTSTTPSIPFSSLSSLRIRMNDITQSSVLYLFQKMILLLSNNKMNPKNGSEDILYDHQYPIYHPLSTLDMSFNNFGHENNNVQQEEFYRHVELILSNPFICPINLLLENCQIGPSICRSIGKSLIDRYETYYTSKQKQYSHEHVSETTPIWSSRHNILSLYLSGNKNIGNAGMVALAAAIRSISIFLYDHVNSSNSKVKKSQEINDENDQQQEQQDLLTTIDDMVSPILDTLDLSSCHISDIGIQAMAMAFEEFFLSSDQCPIRELYLTNNHITDQGVMSFGKVLSQQQQKSSSFLLDLSGNVDITDRSINSLFGSSGVLSSFLVNGWSIILRSCYISADGTESLGKALRQYLISLSGDNVDSNNNNLPHRIHIDLSGNPLGILRGKKHQKGNTKNRSSSSSSFTKKATATATSYMNTGMTFLKKAGITFPTTIESDDEAEEDEEEKAQKQGSEEDDDYDPSRGRCGLKALSNAFTNIMSNDHNIDTDTFRYKKETSTSSSLRQQHKTVIIKLGLRHIFCDIAGADALAYMITYAKDIYPYVQFEIDLDLNPILEDDMVKALLGAHQVKDSLDSNIISEMSQRHYHAMQILKETRQRTMEANRIAKARYKAQSVLDGLSMKDNRNNHDNKKSNSYQRSNYYDEINNDEDDIYDENDYSDVDDENNDYDDEEI